jgi:hypothetical protein
MTRKRRDNDITQRPFDPQKKFQWRYKTLMMHTWNKSQLGLVRWIACKEITITIKEKRSH